jgi:hypothetical protein
MYAKRFTLGNKKCYLKECIFKTIKNKRRGDKI